MSSFHFSYRFVNKQLLYYYCKKVVFTCYFQTFILNSCKKVGDMGFPFGYLKASSNLQTVNLFVMPYNFPVLFPIVGKNIHSASCKYFDLVLTYWQWVCMETLAIFFFIFVWNFYILAKEYYKQQIYWQALLTVW